VTHYTGAQKTVLARLKSQLLLNARVVKYAIVGFTGIAVNLGTLALLLRISSQRGWMPSAGANIVSTAGNFVLHNLWTFSDRQHQGLRLVRGFLFFAFMSAVGICITTAAYVSFTRIAAYLPIVHGHPGGLGILLTCQFVAILLGASISYVLNWKFTWPETPESAPADTTEVQEI
jgi:putative flippase GtrA